MAVLASLLAFVMTLAGGLAAMRIRDHRHLVLGLAGGLMLGVVAFDLIPESLELTRHRPLGVPAPMIGFAAGFVLLHVVEQAVAIHRAHEDEYAPHVHAHGAGSGGLVAASALVAHSLVDGLSIGLGFQSGTDVGVFVALAVVTHDFTDGFNTFTAASLHRTDRRPAVLLLLADAAAPVAGAALGTLASVPDAVLGPYLGLFAGVLLYLAAAEILPEAHSVHPRIMTLCATGLGLLAVLCTVGLAG
ncbi:ZIP family metal transporter [Actinomadura madurae]|uniref:Zinc transporter, ZIP family n=1 Tax=Actinomadura madurae TaxID=1993 RepID=A0A1I5LVB7_9ACTN|nr:ZIP family metal transporter [Actinomadura madurae]SFP00716.1 zinc transporter, ZIP family [Actinomadura madurae]SPT52197.1 zinc transporter ZupT [Actinomadura madurae]